VPEIQLNEKTQRILQGALGLVPIGEKLEPRQLFTSLLVTEQAIFNKLGLQVEPLLLVVKEQLIEDAPDDETEYRKVELSDETRKVLNEAATLAGEQEADSVGTYQLTISLVRHGGERLRKFLSEVGVDPDQFANNLLAAPQVWTAKTEALLSSIGEDWTNWAKEGKIASRKGREKEVDRLIETLLHHDKRNPLLVGAAGVGKSTLIEQLALHLISDKLPERLRGLRLIHIHPDRMFAGVNKLPDFSARVESLINEAGDGKTILFLDDIHRYVIDESGNFNAALANVVKALLVHPEVIIIGATSTVQYFNYVEGDAALDRRFDLIRVTEPDEDAILAMLQESASELEEYHQVRISATALKAALRLAGVYLHRRRRLDASIDILDQASARAYLSRGDNDSTPRVRLAEVEQTVVEMTGINTPGVTANLRKKFRNLEKFLNKRVIGQAEAVETISGVIRYTKSKFDLSRSKPDGVFLLIGPSGSGKTKISASLAEFFFGDASTLIDFGLGQLNPDKELHDLMGNEGPTLVNYVRQLPNGVILLDNIDKTSPEVRDYIRRIIHQGWALDSAGNAVDFSNATILMTAFRSTFTEGGLGYTGSADYLEDPTKLRSELEKVVGPRFLNSIDEIVLLRRLTVDDSMQILENKLLPEAMKLMEEQGVKLEVTTRALKYIARMGYSETFGASYLKNTFKRLVLIPVTTRLFEMRSHKNASVRVVLRGDNLAVIRQRD